MVNKSDTFTALNKQKEFYSDFLNNFAISPFGDDLARVVNSRSVTQSIKNLIKTVTGERLFQPDIGCSFYGSIFELNDNITDTGIAMGIKNTIENFETRCNLISVSAETTGDNSVNVDIVYSLINNLTPITINLSLKRVK